VSVKTFASRARVTLFGVACFTALGASTAWAQSAPDASTCVSGPVDAAVVKAFAPNGTLRASINLGNPVLASLDPQTGEATGVSVDLATEFAKRLNVRLQLVPVRSANASVENVERNRADIGFFAVDPKRAAEISFTRPYVLIEGAYAVRSDSPITHNEDVDQPNVTVAVSKGSAYDLFLSRTLKQATIVRISPSAAVMPAFVSKHLDVLAGIKPQLEQEASKSNSGLRMLDQRFMVIRQAMGVGTARGSAASTCLANFIDNARKSGLVAASLAKHHIEGATVANDGD
jgi:polar amino acid transport system substrate-binding protein